MDIGSAKPSKEEIKKYNYKMINLIEPSVNFNVNNYLDILKETVEKNFMRK